MIQIPHQQILDRYDTIPENLKDAGLSPYNTLLIKKIGEANHLTEEKISTISQLVGYVLFGFIHSEDLANEIKESINLNPEIANSIASEIDRKIFAPIRTDLETVYAPLIAEEALTAKPSPEEILDLRPKVEEPKPVEEAVFPTVEAPIAETPAPSEAPKIIPSEEKPESAKPPKVSPMGIPSAPIFPQSEVGPSMAGEAEPVIIHKEAEFKPLSETKKSLGGLFRFLRKKEDKTEERAEPVRAQVEIGEKSLKAEPHKITKTEPPKIRVVHYSEFEEPVSPFPLGSEKSKAEIEEKKAEEKIEIKPPAVKKIEPPENLPGVMPVKPLVTSPQTPFKAGPIMPPIGIRPIETKPPIPPIERKIESVAPASSIEPKAVEVKPSMVSPSVAFKTGPIEPPASPVKPPGASGIEPLDLRKPPAESKPVPEKSVAEKKEGEEMIDLSTFQKI